MVNFLLIGNTRINILVYNISYSCCTPGTSSSLEVFPHRCIPNTVGQNKTETESGKHEVSRNFTFKVESLMYLINYYLLLPWCYNPWWALASSMSFRHPALSCAAVFHFRPSFCGAVLHLKSSWICPCLPTLLNVTCSSQPSRA